MLLYPGFVHRNLICLSEVVLGGGAVVNYRCEKIPFLTSYRELILNKSELTMLFSFNQLMHELLY